MKTYNNINENFKEVFHNLSEGEGELVLENPEDPLSGGLDMKVSIRDKKHQRLGSLSGGEKSLTALAFVFAIQRYMPSPFYAFDEVDASLDTMNVERIAQMVQNQSKDTQFIVVSHRKPMIESANRTIGVTQKEKTVSHFRIYFFFYIKPQMLVCFYRPGVITIHMQENLMKIFFSCFRLYKLQNIR